MDILGCDLSSTFWAGTEYKVAFLLSSWRLSLKTALSHIIPHHLQWCHQSHPPMIFFPQSNQQHRDHSHSLRLWVWPQAFNYLPASHPMTILSFVQFSIICLYSKQVNSFVIQCYFISLDLFFSNLNIASILLVAIIGLLCI